MEPSAWAADMSQVGDEVRYRLLRILDAKPHISQRELAAELGMSLGKVNYCLKALIARGQVKIRNFKNSKNKAAYAYLLTPRGIEEKTCVTLRFLRARMAEFDALSIEIDRLRHEADELERRAGGREQQRLDSARPNRT